MSAWFERLADPFAPAALATPPDRFWPFKWAASEGLRLHIALMAMCSRCDRHLRAVLF